VLLWKEIITGIVQAVPVLVTNQAGMTVPMVNLTVVPMVVHMVIVSMAHGHVMVRQTVMMAVMKLTVLLHHVKTKV
jgi:hypothetical protein